MRTIYSMTMIWVVLVIFIPEAQQARAQSVLLEPNSGPAVQLEALKPNARDLDISTASFTFYLSGRFAVGGENLLRLELPFVHYEEEDSYNPWGAWGGESAVGNPYLGLDLGNPDNGFQLEAGMRLPLLKKGSEAAAAGAMSDYTERIEAFLPNLMPLLLGANYHLRSEGGFGLRLRGAPVFWLWTGDSSSAENEIYLLYSAQAWYENRTVGIGGGLTGRYLVTSEGAEFDETSLHQLAFFANFSFGSFIPGFQARYPLDDDLRNIGLETTYSFSLGWKL